MKTVAPLEVGLVALDIDTLLPFYTEVLGLALLTDITVSRETSRAAGLAPEGYRVVRLESTGGDRIKLAQSLAAMAPSAPAPYPMARQGGAYVTFIVDDLPSLHERLRECGAAIRSEGVVVLRPGVSMVLATDPEHNWLEFVCYDDIASYRPLSKE